MRSSLVMSAGTVLSRFGGVLRGVALAAALGAGTVADMFTLGNTLPNVVYILVIGGALNAVFIPELVRHMKDDADGGDGYAAPAHHPRRDDPARGLDPRGDPRPVDRRGSTRRRSTRSSSSTWRPRSPASACRRSSSTASTRCCRRCSTPAAGSARRCSRPSRTTSSPSRRSCCSSSSPVPRRAPTASSSPWQVTAARHRHDARRGRPGPRARPRPAPGPLRAGARTSPGGVPGSARPAAWRSGRSGSSWSTRSPTPSSCGWPPGSTPCPSSRARPRGPHGVHQRAPHVRAAALGDHRVDRGRPAAADEPGRARPPAHRPRRRRRERHALGVGAHRPGRRRPSSSSAPRPACCCSTTARPRPQSAQVTGALASVFALGLLPFTLYYVILRGWYALELTRTAFWVTVRAQRAQPGDRGARSTPSSRRDRRAPQRWPPSPSATCRPTGSRVVVAWRVLSRRIGGLQTGTHGARAGPDAPRRTRHVRGDGRRPAPAGRAPDPRAQARGPPRHRASSARWAWSTYLLLARPCGSPRSPRSVGMLRRRLPIGSLTPDGTAPRGRPACGV